MKNLTRRIISSMLCAAVTAVNLGVGYVIPEMSASTLTVNAASSTDSSMFDERSQSLLGSDADSLAVKNADPYGTTDSSGNGTKWKALSVIPEVYLAYKDCRAALIDYDDGNISVKNGDRWSDPAFRQGVSAGINIGNGKKDTVARLSYYSGNNSYRGLYISIIDPVNGGWKTDGIVTYSCEGYGYDSSYVSGSGSKQSFPLSLQCGNVFFDSGDGELRIAQFDYLADSSVNPNIYGQYLSVAAGDFDGDGTDSIIAYIPDLNTPTIKEYGYTKKNVSDFNKTTYQNLNWTFSGANYYKPYFHQTISSNVYTDFSLTKFDIPSDNAGKSRNAPIVDIIAEDIDKDGCDELIVTAGLGYTTTDNNCNTVMKIYDMINGKFVQTYSKSLSGNYNGQQGRIRWASSAVGNVCEGANGELGSDFPEIVTAGWVDIKNATGIDMKHRFGVHITELTERTKKNGTYVGTYQEKLVIGTSDGTIGSAGSDGISQYMKNGFPVGWNRHDKLAVNTIAYKGPAKQAALMLGDTVYDITSEYKLSAAYWSKDFSDHTRYSVRKSLTGNYPMTTGLTGESAYFLIADTNNTYAAYTYYYKNGKWYTGSAVTGSMDISDDYWGTDICNVDVDNDSVYVKLKDVVKTWADPKPLYVLEAAPYFSEFPDSKGTTGVGYGYESGHEVKWNAGISAGIEASFSQQIAFFGVEIGGTEFGTSLTTAMTYEGSKSTSKSVNVNYTNNSDENAVLVERTPMYIYRYNVLGKDNLSDPANIIVTGTPEMAMISVEDYNELAQTFNDNHKNDSSRQLTKIDDTFGLGTPGDPLTYRKTFPNAKENELFTITGSKPTAYYGSTGSTEKTITKSSTLTNGFSVEITSETYIGGSLFGVGGKFTWDVTAGTGASFFHTDSTACSGEVGRQNSDGRFNFNWDMARWVKNGIPVVGYAVTLSNEDISNIPPVTPSGLTVTGKGNNSATLKWTNPATTNGRITANYINVYYKKDADLSYTSKRVLLQGTEGEKVWSLSGLERNTKYKCYIANAYIGNAGSSNESFQSNIIEFTTNNDKEAVDVTINAGKGIKLKSGKVIQSVDRGIEAIENVIYSVSDGYQLPKGFYVSSNGIEAQSAGIDIIKVSGTPTAAATINIPDMDIINYSISYTLNNGTLANRVTSYNIESETITLPKPVRDGYEFAGWTDAYGNEITQIKKGSTGNITLEANWTDLSYLGYTANYPADGSEQYPYIISSAKGWNLFCDLLADKDKGYFTGKTVKLGENITVSKMAGGDSHDFTGTFDGNGKTLTFNYTADVVRVAPFRYVQGSADSHAVIKNLNVISNITSTSYKHLAGLVALQTGYVDITNCNVKAHISSTSDTDKTLYPAALVSQASYNGVLTVKGCKVTGDITTNGKYAAGFVGVVQGTTNIENCMSSITINSSVDIDGNKDGTHGGFVGEQQGKSYISIKGCMFNGKLLTDNGTIKCGGFIGWRNNKAAATVYDSIFAPAEVTVGNEYSATFARNLVDTYNCYYTYSMNDGNNYVPYLSDGDVTPKKYNNGQQAYTITAGDNVTIDYGTPESTYDISGITAYKTGLAYNGTFYAGKDDEISLNLGYNKHQGYKFNNYTAGDATLTENENNYTLTMPDGNVTISAVEETVEPLLNKSEISTDEIVLGDSVTINAIADGGEGEYTYAVLYKETTNTKWTVVQNYKANANVSVKPETSGKYDICVKVKDENGDIEKKYFAVNVKKPVLSNNATVSSSSITLGYTVTIKTASTGGTAPYTYAVYTKQSTVSKWTEIQAYSTNSSVDFKPTEKGTYDICVKVKDKSGTVEKKYFAVNVVSELQNNSELSASEITLGDTITATAKGEGGTGEYTYAVLYKKKSDTKWTVKQNYKTDSTVTIKPAHSVEYDVCIKVKDSNGSIAKKYFTVNVKKLALTNNATVSSSSITLGNTVTVNAAAIGGTTPYTYAVYTKKSTVSKWTENQAYSANASINFKPAEEGTYDICVKVKDQSGTIEKKYLTVTVK